MTCADSSSDPGLLLALNGADERLQLAVGRITTFGRITTCGPTTAPGRMEAGGAALLAAQEWTVPGEAARFLAPGIRQLLDGLGHTAGQVRRIACVVGPGSFTGLRMSLALAQGLALATGAELAGLNHLELLAGEAAQLAPGAVAALVWSRRGQVYAQAFQRASLHAFQCDGGDRATPFGPPQVVPLTAMQDYLSALPRPLSLLGGGLRRNLAFFEALAERDAGLRLLPPAWDAARPAALLDLASRAAFGPGPLEPAYLRASDAEDNLAAFAAKRGLSEADAQTILDHGSRTV
ncbi:MAG: tRNA (adenosine(37)-N6)-threonylcarbamoyltransferase complex dimerization subunit type 1 TsaB [Humidesulfovibrio sp.]|nr:tRNA (adenosine(37)-N6)-threonylcarbamoyltransferase complex dimerization subunit type 1 TsaB [Desulfovibrio sp.]MDO9083922.1 tRNA (adenosine(37)-N6)-threonylcarbamoyltransferase complex dimerization subunit type 1 TsaB [Humidesulfovibrio sp.]